MEAAFHHSVVASKDGELGLHVLAQLPAGQVSNGTKAEARCLLREKLTRAVQHRMVADVEVGAFLSGGIDSSLIVGIMTKELGVKPQTFTIGFAEKAFDERRF